MGLKIGDMVLVRDDSDEEIHRGPVSEIKEGELEDGTNVLVKVEGHDSFFGIQQVFRI